MATKSEKDDAAKKAADDKQQVSERFTRERLQSDCDKLQGNISALERQLVQAQNAVIQLQGRINATVGALSYCQELLGAYGVAPKPIPETKPVESKSQRRRKNIQQGKPMNEGLPNGHSAADVKQSGGSQPAQVE